MTHNKVFITNLYKGLSDNMDEYLAKAFKSNENYASFMNSLANVIFKKMGMPKERLPITTVAVDPQQSTGYVIALTYFDSAFVKEPQDAYFFAVALDDDINMRIFDYELDVDSNKNRIYSFCEYSLNGSRKVLKTARVLSEQQFAKGLYSALKN